MKNNRMTELETQLAEINTRHDEQVTRLASLKRQIEAVPPLGHALLSYAEHGGELDILALAGKASDKAMALKAIDEAIEHLDRQHGNATRANQLARQAENANFNELARCRTRIGSASATPAWCVHDLLRAAGAMGGGSGQFRAC